MGLLAPWFLAGLAALGLPVWLHLLKRRRSPPREFSSLMLFERRVESSLRQRRLRYLLLLALRCLLLAALALAFARPYRETAAGAAAGRLIVLALDESYSMRQGDRMARARREAADRLERLSAGDRVQIVAFSDSVRLLSEPGRDRAAARAAIESVRPGDGRGSYAELVRALGSIARAAGVPVEAHVFTDLQRSGLPPSFQDLIPPPGLRLELHPAADQAVDNWTVEAVRVPARLYGPQAVRIQATVAGFARRPAGRRVALALASRVLESKEVEAPAGGRALVEFTLSELRHGVHRAEVRIEPPDEFPDDDRRLFALERADPRPALFVHEARERRAWLYFRTALEASGGGAFRPEEATLEQAGALKLARYAFIVLSDAGWLPESFAQALRAYLEGGGSVWITLGSAALARRQVPLWGGPVSALGDGAGSLPGVSQVDQAHPALERTGRWEGVKFYRAARLEAAEARVLARLADGTPLLMEKPVGAGRLLVFASALDNLANDFPLHPSFVPFIERVAAYLGGLQQEGSALTVGAHLTLRTAAEQGVAVEVIGPDGRRALSLSEATTAGGLALRQAGYYEVRRGGGRNQTLAVNPDPRESDLALIPAETLALWRAAGSREAPGTGGGGGERARRGLWQAMLLLALAAAAAESWTANKYLAGGGEAT
jgi:hypothetical protein